MIGPAALPWHQGDVELARRVLVETKASAVPSGPRLTDYIAALWDAAFRAIASLLAQVFSGAGGALPLIRLAAIALAAVALVLAAVAIAKRVIARRRRAGLAEKASRVEVADLPAGPRDAAAWRRELEARLSRGDVAGALEALWWWLAETLTSDAGERVDASWTTRDVMTRAENRRARGATRRPARDLARLGVELDVLMYGRDRPSVADVAASLRRFEDAVG